MDAPCLWRFAYLSEGDLRKEVSMTQESNTAPTTSTNQNLALGSANSSQKNARDKGSEKYQAILTAAAILFAEKGYKATSIRDIGNKVGVLGGSLYHHIKSKDALFLAIHSAATQRAENQISQALKNVSDPWERLEIACTVLLEIQLDPNSLTRPLMEDFRAVPDNVREKLIVQRDLFEKIFAELVAELPLPETVDRPLFRIFVLSMLNNVAQWYKKGRLSPSEIAHQMIMILRRDS